MTVSGEVGSINCGTIQKANAVSEDREIKARISNQTRYKACVKDLQSRKER